MEKKEWWRLAPKIVVTPPGPKALEIMKMDSEYLVTSTKLKIKDVERAVDVVLAVEEGKNATLRDVDGNVYIDLIAGVATASVGHSHPRVVDAVRKQVEKLVNFCGCDFYNKSQVKLAKKLVEITPGDFPKKVFLSNSGTEAVECALKLAKCHREKPRVISFIGAFHGRTFGSLGLGGSKPVHFRHFAPLVGGVQTTHVPYCYCYRCPHKLEFPDCDLWCVDYIKDVCFQTFLPPEDVSALVAEPIQGEGGYVVPQKEFFPRLKKICDEYGLLLIVDEIQSGFGRTGKMFAIEHWGVTPDIVCMGKGIASGMPMGATVARAELDFKDEGSHSNTFGGNLVVCEAASATIATIEEEKLAENAAKVGSNIMKRLRELMENHSLIGDVRGKGLMIGVELVKDRKTKTPAKEEAELLIMEAWKRGIVLMTCGVSTIRMLPPLNIPSELVDRAMDVFENALNAVERKT